MFLTREESETVWTNLKMGAKLSYNHQDEGLVFPDGIVDNFGTEGNVD